MMTMTRFDVGELRLDARSFPGNRFDQECSDNVGIMRDLPLQIRMALCRSEFFLIHEQEAQLIVMPCRHLSSLNENQ